MTPSEEQHALIHYLLTANPGPVLTLIAETRIKDLERLNSYTPSECVQKPPIKKVKCSHAKLGVTFNSIRMAARFLRIPEQTLQRDMAVGRFKYGIKPILSE